MQKQIKGLFSIRNRIFLWFTLGTSILLFLTLAVVWFISMGIMENQERHYLISLVEENSDKLIFLPKKDYKKAKKEDSDDIYIKYKKGYIQIDDDFLDTIHEVQSGLYTEDGILLYGENPIYKDTLNEAFTSSRVYKARYDDINYFLYDRKIDLKGSDTLWIRGVVPLTQTEKQMKEIVKNVLAFLPLLLIILLLCAYLAAKGILIPIKKMEETAVRIANSNDMKLRIAVGEENDELSHLASVFNLMLERLEDLFLTEKQFTSDASHELRTPAAVITTQVEYALDKERTPSEYISTLQTIKRQTRRMNILISDMLDYTRLEKRMDDYKMEAVNLSSLTEDICSDMLPLAIRQIFLTSSIEPDIHITGNKELLIRMLQNLIENAYKYGKENGSIHVTLKKEKENAVLTIEDNGIGMSEEMKEKIFERFFRGENTDSKGNGLGLSMVKKIAEIHHIPIQVESHLGKGSTFTLFFKN